jgi:hypothetical protein
MKFNAIHLEAYTDVDTLIGLDLCVTPEGVELSIFAASSELVDGSQAAHLVFLLVDDADEAKEVIPGLLNYLSEEQGEVTAADLLILAAVCQDGVPVTLPKRHSIGEKS